MLPQNSCLGKLVLEIWPKCCWSTDYRIFESNMSLEQNVEKACFWGVFLHVDTN